jgi:acyl-CoA reductase-like NAD-dependent aldehyde dehydrogenase
MISFPGSSAVGRLVGAAGGTLKKVSLELGGNNALIVLDDADLEVASSAGAWSAFLHPDAEQRRVRAVRRHGSLRERLQVRVAEQLGRVHALAVADAAR